MQTSSSIQTQRGNGTPGTATPDLLDLSVIIVNYNVREFLEQALRSVQKSSTDLCVEVFVVDNNSVDGSVEMVRTQFPDVHLIANEDNIGFGKANNQAIEQARGRYLLILNPDTIIQEDTFSTMIRFMEDHPDAGALGCQILNPDGSFAPESRRAFPTPEVAFYRMVGLSRLFPRSRTFGRYNLTYLPRDEVAEVDALSGSCMLVRHAALYHANEQSEAGSGAGLFDEDFFMYGEDLDWCFRIQQAGWKIYYTPETQIIHYKGESTKKGEIRYVRLFYGAMRLFSQKHFQDRYSGLFAGLVQVGIMVRAALSMTINTLRRLRIPFLDFSLVFLIVALVGYLRSAQLGSETAPLFLASVAPGYALGTVLGIALSGGYARGKLNRIRPVFLGTITGFLFVATASFFVKEIAFSRIVVLMSVPVIILTLSAWRLAWYARHSEPNQALLVGHAAEAVRLQTMLAGHPKPPFTLAGYVEPEKDRLGTPAEAVPCLGTLHHLRDLVRLRQIDDVVFATDDLSNGTIFQLMTQLRDLPVQFRMLAEGREHVIGKAAIDDLSTPTLIKAEKVLGVLRSNTARRAFEVPVALFGLLLHPVLWLASRVGGPHTLAAHLARRTQKLPRVLAGRCVLVGYDPNIKPHPPAAWGLRPGVFAITETLQTASPNPQEINRAYWFYASHQSASLDLDIIVRAFRKHQHPPESSS